MAFTGGAGTPAPAKGADVPQCNSPAGAHADYETNPRKRGDHVEIAFSLGSVGSRRVSHRNRLVPTKLLALHQRARRPTMNSTDRIICVGNEPPSGLAALRPFWERLDAERSGEPSLSTVPYFARRSLAGSFLSSSLHAGER